MADTDAAKNEVVRAARKLVDGSTKDAVENGIALADSIDTLDLAEAGSTASSLAGLSGSYDAVTDGFAYPEVD